VRRLKIRQIVTQNLEYWS